MKVVILLVVLSVCSQLCWVSAANIPPPVLTVTSTTTSKPWSTKLKDGLNTFFQGVAVAGAVQGAVQNHRNSKHKPTKPH
ncbi:hypothetical protein evm_000285 [Chilo suppressalis]|nr:hypothetical protein evm_000285 [Chilo suppressalis]